MSNNFPRFVRPLWQQRALDKVDIADWALRNKGRAFLGILLRFSRVLSRITPSRVRVVCHFAFFLHRLIKHQGSTGAVLTLKAAYILVQQSAARQVPVTNLMEIHKRRVKRSRRGFPKFIPAIEREKMWNGDVSVCKFWLSMLSIYRFIDCKHPIPSSFTITNPGKVFHLAEWDFDLPLNFVKLFWRRLPGLQQSCVDSLADYWSYSVNFPSKGRLYGVLLSLTTIATAFAQQLLPVKDPNRISGYSWKALSSHTWLVGRSVTAVFVSYLFSPFPLLRGGPQSFKFWKLQAPWWDSKSGEWQYSSAYGRSTSYSFFSVLRSLEVHRGNIKYLVSSFVPYDWWRGESVEDVVSPDPKVETLGDQISSFCLYWWIALMDSSALLATNHIGFNQYHTAGSFSSMLDFRGGHRVKVSNAIAGIGEKQEAAGKTRMFAYVDPITQWALKPLHDYLFGILRNIPQDGTFDQHAPVRALWRKYPGRKEKYCFDLTAATDRLPISLQVLLLRPLIGDLAATCWRWILVGRSYWWSQSLGKGQSVRVPLKYAVGQPMGALSSWAMLALTHHALVQYSAWLAYPSERTWFTKYGIIGDDLTIWDRKVANSYLSVMDKIGVGINLGKSLIGSNVEFAKRYTMPLGDASPVSLKDWWVSTLCFQGAVDFMEKYSIKFTDLLWTLGGGYKVVSRSNRRLEGRRRLPDRQKRLVITMTSPPKSGWTMDQWLTSTHPGVPGRGQITPQWWRSIITYELARLLKFGFRTQLRLKPYVVGYTMGTDPSMSFSVSKLFSWLQIPIPIWIGNLTSIKQEILDFKIDESLETTQARLKVSATLDQYVSKPVQHALFGWIYSGVTSIAGGLASLIGRRPRTPFRPVEWDVIPASHKLSDKCQHPAAGICHLCHFTPSEIKERKLPLPPQPLKAVGKMSALELQATWDIEKYTMGPKRYRDVFNRALALRQEMELIADPAQFQVLDDNVRVINDKWFDRYRTWRRLGPYGHDLRK